MRIADPSIENMGDVELLFFARNSDLLPTPKCVGHIVRLHRMLVRAHAHPGPFVLHACQTSEQSVAGSVCSCRCSSTRTGPN